MNFREAKEPSAKEEKEKELLAMIFIFTKKAHLLSALEENYGLMGNLLIMGSCLISYTLREVM